MPAECTGRTRGSSREEKTVVRWWLSLLFILTWSCTAPAQQAPGPVGAPEGVWRDQIHWIPMTDASGASHLLYARTCRPVGGAPVRVVAIAHGTSGNYRAAVLGRCDSEVARWFLDRGFVVIFALRRGYGASGGNWAEGIYHRPCNAPDYARAGIETARDIAATVDYGTALPFARPQAAVVIGQSGGGWGTMAYNSMPHPRVTALISMAGGRGQVMTKSGLIGICRPDLLADAAGRLAQTATTPMLWIYAENDRFFAPEIAVTLHKAFSENGGKAELQQL